MNIRCRVDREEAERAQFEAMPSGGKHAVRKLKRAQILVAADVREIDEVIVCTASVGGSTMHRTKCCVLEGNLEATLNEKPRPGAALKLSGKGTALLVATACSNPPAGRKRWRSTCWWARRCGPSTRQCRTKRSVGNIGSEYVARIQDVLDLSAVPAGSARPVVCFDMSPTKLIGEVRQPVPAAPGRF